MNLATRQRQARILKQIASDGAVSIRELCDLLGVSRETVRKDLDALAERNKLRKLRGGAVRIAPQEPPAGDRARTNPAGKRAIGRHAAALVPENATVLLDSGTTTAAAAEALAARPGAADLTVLTNDLHIALRLRDAGAAVHLLGGLLRRDEDSTGGHDAIAMLAGFRVDLAFVGVGGLDLSGRFTDFTREGAELRRQMLDAAQAAYLLADRGKIGRVAPFALRGADRAAGLITDRAPPAALARALGALGLEVLTPEP